MSLIFGPILVNTERLDPSKSTGKRKSTSFASLKMSFFLTSSGVLYHTVIEIGRFLPADNNDLNDRCVAYKKQQQQKVTKQTGQCLTLSSVRLDLLSCCCFLS